MPLDPQINDALKGSNPFEELRVLAISMRAAGHEQAAILAKFENARRQLRESGREADEDVVMEVMDCLVGWCSPHMNLEA